MIGRHRVPGAGHFFPLPFPHPSRSTAAIPRGPACRTGSRGGVMKDATRFRTFRWLVWTAYGSLWTAALLTTFPIEVRDAVVPAPYTFSASKVLHVSAYAVFAVLTGWLALGRPWRWRCWGCCRCTPGGPSSCSNSWAHRRRCATWASITSASSWDWYWPGNSGAGPGRSSRKTITSGGRSRHD